MNDIALKVYVAPSDFFRGVRIAIVLQSQVTQVAKVIDGGELEFVTVEPRKPWPATLEISTEMAQELLAGLLKLNLPTPSAGAIEGELKATKIHLEDLRQLLKITKRHP
jgi:hypothetical protein